MHMWDVFFKIDTSSNPFGNIFDLTVIGLMYTHTHSLTCTYIDQRSSHVYAYDRVGLSINVSVFVFHAHATVLHITRPETFI